MLATYPFLSVLWDMLLFFGFIIWIWLLITCFADIFRRRDISGFSKALWIIFLIILPYFGVLIYLIAEHQGMADRSAQMVQAQQAQMDSYVKSVAASADPAEQIAKGKQLLDSGAITQAEFDDLKKKALA
ncbi:MAG TPA: SHOCT domain-containing protein [Gaiellaceae bacterium]|nr:SHOCT domain-containing protein [Gaiellaceae bacterium]